MNAGVADGRRYGELCPIALGLDVIGHRWALLIIRELFAGPKRFTDLEQGLPGIGSSVLAARLRQLEHQGLLTRHQLPRPAPAVVYRLTPRGAALEPVMVDLAGWGAIYLMGGDKDRARRGRWLLQAMSAAAGPPPDGIQTVNFVLDGEESHVRVIGGRLAARDGLGRDVTTEVRGSVHDLYQVAIAPVRSAAASGGFEIEGEREAADRMLDHLITGFQQAAESWRSKA